MNQKIISLTSEEAISQLQKGKLEGCSIAELDLRNRHIDFPIHICNSHIGSIFFTDAKVNAPMHFEEVTFDNDFSAGWERASEKISPGEFRAEVVFKKCQFKGKAIFGGCLFERLFSCQDAKFYDIAIFKSVSFKEQAYFWGSKFHEHSFFERCTFHVEGHFDKCEFLDGATFEGATFDGEDASFSYIKSEGDLNFQNAKVNCYFAIRKSQVNGEIKFTNSSFAKETYFQNSFFRGQASFDKTDFKSLVDFSNSKFEASTSFLSASFLETKFINVEFADEVLFNLDSHLQKSLGKEPEKVAIFQQLSDFTNTRFHKRVVFENVEFKSEARFSNCFFGEQANFIKVRSQSLMSFNSIYCNQEFSGVEAIFNEVTFDYANINRRLDLSDAQMKEISFYKAAVDLVVIEKAQIKAKLIHERPKNPEFAKSSQEYLLLKESFGQRGLHEEEDWAYYKFRQAKRKSKTRAIFAKFKQVSVWKKFVSLFRLIVLFFERIVIDRATGYGTRPLNVTIVAASFIFLFASIYYYFSAYLVRPEGMPFEFSQAVYFSFATFTTMGFGDIQPRLDSLMTFVVSMEAFFGLFVMTLFVGTYTRKIIR